MAAPTLVTLDKRLKDMEKWHDRNKPKMDKIHQETKNYIDKHVKRLEASMAGLLSQPLKNMSKYVDRTAEDKRRSAIDYTNLKVRGLMQDIAKLQARLTKLENSR